MKFLKIISILVLSLSMTLFFASCGESTGSKTESPNSEESSVGETADSPGDGHNHEAGHDHEHGHDHAANSGSHGEGKAYSAAYICIMHCEGSGSDAPGKCPVCSMDYVAQADHVSDGHTHED